MKGRKGFTLIELLIVVAIIAILAAIAVPNFLEAQVRSKVARSKSDMRTTATALEAYNVDAGKYPPWLQAFTKPCFSLVGNTDTDAMWGLCRLTTPMAYLTSVPMDVFRAQGQRNIAKPGTVKSCYDYITTSYYSCTQGTPESKADAAGYKWAMAGVGPSRNQASPGLFVVILGTVNPQNNLDKECVSYDPSNGTTSRGFIVRTNKGIWTTPME